MLSCPLLVLSYVCTIGAAISIPRLSDNEDIKSPQSRVIYQFPKPTWNENLAVRQGNELLVTQITAPDVYLLTTSPTLTATLIHSFEPFKGVLGITEVQPDHFYVVAGKFSLSPPDLGLGTYTIHSIDLTSYDSISNTNAVIKQIASITNGGLINGLSTLDVARGLIIAADSTYGIIWLINVHTGNVSILLEEPEMAPLASSPFSIGINGVHPLIKPENDTAEIYFDNTATETFYRVPIFLSTLKKAGPVETVKANVSIDDFALDGEKCVAYLASGAENAVFTLGLEDGSLETVAGGLNETTVPGPTSVVLGRGQEKDSIFVTNNGAVLAPVGGIYSEGGKVVEVEVVR